VWIHDLYSQRMLFDWLTALQWNNWLTLLSDATKACKNFAVLINICNVLLLSGELLTERCRTVSFAFLQAVWTPKFWGWTSSSITLSQMDLGRPGGLRQSGGGRSAAAMTRWWSSSGADRARCPKNLNRNDLTFSEIGKQPVMLLTVSFVVCLV